jgi:hypothetical protein
MAVTIGQGGSANMLSNDPAITSNTTVPSSQNWASVGPITINSGVTVTVNGDWSIV